MNQINFILLPIISTKLDTTLVAMLIKLSQYGLSNNGEVLV